MMRPMRRFGIIRNTEKPGSEILAEKLSAYLAGKGASSWISVSGTDLPGEAECAVVLGGDGTLLRAAKCVTGRDIPLLGINLGALGYLAEVDPGNMFEAADRLLSGNYTIEKRMMLKGTICRGSAKEEDIALNEIVLSRTGPLRSFRIRNYVNEELLNSYSADGVILSTATGSTGYSLSVGGPIVSPDAELILMTPLAAHTLISRSIIFSGGDSIRVEIAEGQTGSMKEAAAVRFDGGGLRPLSTGDSVVITRATQYTELIRMNNISFLEVLRSKMADA